MLKDVIISQKAELESVFQEQYVEREVKPFSLKHNLIKVIIGPRRAGKSFFVLHTLKQAGKFGYANFDNESLVDIKDYDNIISEINQVYGNQKILFFDEIQNLAKWEIFVNRLQRQGYNIVVTGSNSKLLSKELATHLTGRHLPITVLTFSFKEYLKAKNIDLKDLTTHQKEEQLLEHLQVGGYPETIIKKLDAKNYLEVLFDSIIYKDIIKRYNVRKGNDIEKLAIYLLSNIATEFSYLLLADVTTIKSDVTVQKYMGFLEEAYLLFTLERFSYKTKRHSQNKKIYCYDNGLISAKAFRVSPNFGKLFENYVAIRLKSKEIDGSIDFYYWKNQQGEEVDFVIKRGLKVVELIQVCYSVEDKRTKDREIRSLLKAGKELRCKNLTILTSKEDKEETEEWFGIRGKIIYKPLWKWLEEN